MNTLSLIASAPTDIVAGLIILTALAGLILFALSTEAGLGRHAARSARRLRNRWLFIPGANHMLAQGSRHDYVV